MAVLLGRTRNISAPLSTQHESELNAACTSYMSYMFTEWNHKEHESNKSHPRLNVNMPSLSQIDEANNVMYYLSEW